MAKTKKRKRRRTAHLNLYDGYTTPTSKSKVKSGGRGMAIDKVIPAENQSKFLPSMYDKYGKFMPGLYERPENSEQISDDGMTTNGGVIKKEPENERQLRAENRARKDLGKEGDGEQLRNEILDLMIQISEGMNEVAEWHAKFLSKIR